MPALAAESSVLRLLEAPRRLLVPVMTSTPGQEAPVIETGTAVCKGQPLLSALPEAGSAALAPTSGRVVRRTPATLTDGREVDAIELEPDFEDRAPPEEPHDPIHAGLRREHLHSMEKAGPEDLGQWIDHLRRAGVWADRRSSPNLIQQLHSLLKRPVDTVICNVVDHAPELRLQGIVGARFGAVVATAMALLARLTTARRTILAVDAGAAPRWWVPLRRELRKGGIEVVAVWNDYPAADPTLLIHALTGRRLRPGRLPVEQGVLMLDAAAASALGRAAARSQPMLRVPVGVRDHLRGRSSFLAAHVGTPVRHILEHLQLPHENISLLAGDVLRDQPISPDAVVGGSELSFHVMRAAAPAPASPCIRCGWCAQACPTRVMPAGVLQAAQDDDPELADKYGIDACIECGICSWVCPSHLPLLKGIRVMKERSRNS